MAAALLARTFPVSWIFNSFKEDLSTYWKRKTFFQLETFLRFSVLSPNYYLKRHNPVVVRQIKDQFISSFVPLDMMWVNSGQQRVNQLFVCQFFHRLFPA